MRIRRLRYATKFFSPNVNNVNFQNVVFTFDNPDAAKIQLVIYRKDGKQVTEINSEGGVQVAWNGLGSDGVPQNSGVYVYVLSLDGNTIGSGLVVLAN